MRRALIFGISGQDGVYLSALLERVGFSVTGVSRQGGKIQGDVGDFEFVDNLIHKLKPEYVFHLAANSSTRHDALFENHHAISTGTINILESILKHNPTARVFLSGSAMQFQNSDAPINETTPFEASSPYSIARIHSTYAARYYRARFGLKVYVGYFFNHDSPLRTARHVNQKIVTVLKRIAAGSLEKLELGDVSVRKEFNFAGDIVAAIWILVNQDLTYEAVIGNGEAHSIKEWVLYCCKRLGVSYEDTVVERSNFTAEYQLLVSDPKIIRSLGWKPEIDFVKLADLMLELP